MPARQPRTLADQLLGAFGVLAAAATLAAALRWQAAMAPPPPPRSWFLGALLVGLLAGAGFVVRRLRGTYPPVLLLALTTGAVPFWVVTGATREALVTALLLAGLAVTLPLDPWLPPDAWRVPGDPRGRLAALGGLLLGVAASREPLAWPLAIAAIAISWRTSPARARAAAVGLTVAVLVGLIGAGVRPAPAPPAAPEASAEVTGTSGEGGGPAERATAPTVPGLGGTRAQAPAGATSPGGHLATALYSLLYVAFGGRAGVVVWCPMILAGAASWSLRRRTNGGALPAAGPGNSRGSDAGHLGKIGDDRSASESVQATAPAPLAAKADTSLLEDTAISSAAGAGGPLASEARWLGLATLAAAIVLAFAAPQTLANQVGGRIAPIILPLAVLLVPRLDRRSLAIGHLAALGLAANLLAAPPAQPLAVRALPTETTAAVVPLPATITWAGEPWQLRGAQDVGAWGFALAPDTSTDLLIGTPGVEHDPLLLVVSELAGAELEVVDWATARHLTLDPVTTVRLPTSPAWRYHPPPGGGAVWSWRRQRLRLVPATAGTGPADDRVAAGGDTSFGLHQAAPPAQPAAQSPPRGRAEPEGGDPSVAAETSPAPNQAAARVFVRPLGDVADLGAALRSEVVTLELPTRAVAGTASWLAVRVRNRGTLVWSAAAPPPVVLSSRFVPDPAGVRAPVDGPRARFDGPIHPGEELALDLRVRWPDAPGRIWLSVDLALERVAWFEDAVGTPLAAGWVEVVPPAASSTDLTSSTD